MGRLARPLATFLRALHDSETRQRSTRPVSYPATRWDVGTWRCAVPRAAERMGEVERLGLWRAPASVRDVLDAAREPGAPEASALVRGDLHILHLLVDDDCGAAGVIDWIDICRGTPRSTCRCSGACCRQPDGESFWTRTGLSAMRNCCAHACWRCS